jgi:hypothetical protein
MRMILCSAVLALGLGLAGSTGASALTLGAGFDKAANANSPIEQVQYGRRHCRSVTTCRRGHMGRRICRTERVCRR